MPEFVKAYDTVTGRKVVVPAHFLGERSPFQSLKPLPSERDSDDKPAVDKAARKPRRASGKPDAPAQAAAATDKEK